MPGPFPQGLNTLSRLRLMCSPALEHTWGSAKALGVTYLGGSTGFREYGRRGADIAV